MNKPDSSRALELRSDYGDVRCGNCNRGGKSWLGKRRHVKKALYKELRRQSRQQSCALPDPG